MPSKVLLKTVFRSARPPVMRMPSLVVIDDIAARFAAETVEADIAGHCWRRYFRSPGHSCPTINPTPVLLWELLLVTVG